MPEPEHPIDREIRAWLKIHAGNKSELSVKVGHSKSWLHKYTNGAGHATIDDLVRLAALLTGLNLPVLTEADRKLLKAIQGMNDSEKLDVVAYAEHRGRLAHRGRLKESSEPEERNHPLTTRKGRGKR